ncbi:MAG: hypothetical protein M2R45_00333 [Verrucomicrobia subdivision 3 bacterium]|nr:hypothetical protein [Limisphaerales bacterium]MCS1412908.1 hypothetical protein [Limisphaerales bacterium]
MKLLHRLIVTSEVYCRSISSRGMDPKSLQADLVTIAIGVACRIRMELQVVRDSMRCYLADDLDLRIGGSTIDLAEGEAVDCRSLYFTHLRDQQRCFLSMFDGADILACYRRRESVIPQQSLINCQLSLELAPAVADRLASVSNTVNDSEFVVRSMESILGVPP